MKAAAEFPGTQLPAHMWSFAICHPRRPYASTRWPVTSSAYSSTAPASNGESRDVVEWDLRNARDREVTSGMYIYQVETPSGEVIQGYLAVIL